MICKVCNEEINEFNILDAVYMLNYIKGTISFSLQ